MSLTELINDAVDKRGYHRDDFEIVHDGAIKSNRESACLVWKVDRIAYPVDPTTYETILRGSGATFLILSDEYNVHIFEQTGYGLREIPHLPLKDVVHNADAAMENNARNIQEVLNSILIDRDVFKDGSDVSDFMIVSAFLGRDNMLDSLSQTLYPFGAVEHAINSLNSEIPGLLSKDVSNKVKEGFINALMKMEGMDFSPSRCLAEVCIKAMNASNHNMNYGISKPVYQISRSIIPGGRTLCYSGNPNLPMSDNTIKMTVMSGNIDGARVVKYLSGSESEAIRSFNIEGGPYDSILLFPPLGMGAIDPGSGRHVRWEYQLLEQALDHLSAEGVMAAVLPVGFLRDTKCRELRKKILEDHALRAVVKIERPFIGTSIQGIILVVSGADGYDSGSFICIDEASIIGEEDIASIVRHPQGSFEGIPGVRILSVDECIHDSGWNIELPQEEYQGIALGECADIIKGVAIQSSDHFPKDSIAGIPLLRVSNISNGRVLLDNAVHIPSSKASVVPVPGDIVISIGAGSIGKCAIVADEVFVPSSQVAILRPKPFVRTETLYHALESESVQSQITMMSNSTVPHISISSLKTVKIKL